MHKVYYTNQLAMAVGRMVWWIIGYRRVSVQRLENLCWYVVYNWRKHT